MPFFELALTLPDTSLMGWESDYVIAILFGTSEFAIGSLRFLAHASNGFVIYSTCIQFLMTEKVSMVDFQLSSNTLCESSSSQDPH